MRLPPGSPPPALSCDDARALAVAGLDEVLSPPDAARLADHLGRCEACMHEASGHAGVDALLTAFRGPPPATSFADRVVAALDRAPDPQEAHAPVPSPPSSPVRRALGQVLAFGSLATAVALFLPGTAAAAALAGLLPTPSLSAGTLSLEAPLAWSADVASAGLGQLTGWIPADAVPLIAGAALVMLTAQIAWVRFRDGSRG